MKAALKTWAQWRFRPVCQAAQEARYLAADVLLLAGSIVGGPDHQR